MPLIIYRVNIDLNILPIRVSTLRGDKKIPFNAYIRVGKRHILYCRKGDSFEGERLERLKAKKLHRLFVTEPDYKLYREYLRINIEEAFDLSKKKDLLTRSQVIHGHQQALAEDIFEFPDEPTYYAMAKQSCQRLIPFMQKEELALKVFLTMPNEDLSLTHHGVNVSILSTSLAIEMGMVQESGNKVCQMLLGALLHDIGHQFINDVDLERSRDDMTMDEWANYIKHPTEGIHRLRESGHIDKSVINIIHEHEEFIDGSGFPQSLLEKDIDPLALIVGTVNTYDRLINFEGMKPAEALKFMIIDRMGLHPLDHMRTLQKVLKRGHLIK